VIGGARHLGAGAPLPVQPLFMPFDRRRRCGVTPDTEAAIEG